MFNKIGMIRFMAIVSFCFAAWLMMPAFAYAHCDTMDGPVVNTARAALDKGDVTPVLKWVKKEDEDEIKKAFKKTLKVRKESPDAKELADMYFFETLVRIHRAGEGAPYTGLKPAGEVEPAIAEADKALETGSIDHLVTILAKHMDEGLKEKFERAIETKKHADDSVEAGREYVEAYITFIHYAEKLHQDITSKGGHHEE
jgi:hypothetical protein